MIPSRTVFNHRKSSQLPGHTPAMGPLCISHPRPTRVEPAPMFSPFHPSMPASQPIPLLSSFLASFPTRILSLEALLPISSLLFDISTSSLFIYHSFFYAGYVFLLLLLAFSFWLQTVFCYFLLLWNIVNGPFSYIS